MMACWKQNEFRDEACKKEIQDFFDCASRAEVTGGSWGALLGGKWGAYSNGSYCLLLGDKKVPLILKGRGNFWKLLESRQSGKGYCFEGIVILSDLFHCF